MSIPQLLDHLVIAGPDLEEVVDWFTGLTGIQAAPGGAHPTGTANALVALTVDGERGPWYVELIGPDPADAGAPPPTKFGIADLTAPQLVTYAVHPADIEDTVRRSRAAGYDPGDVQDLSRRTPAGELLEWRLSRGPAPRRHDVPFLIDWGEAPHPGLSDVPVVELVSFERIEPDPRELQRVTDALGLGAGIAAIRRGPEARFRLVLRRADGGVVEI